jgi:sugar-specific transcriptional regulator TrmB
MIAPLTLDVLSTLLESGSPMFVSAIGKRAKLNRTTTYDILKELEAKGLVSKVKKEGAIRYQAVSIELLPAYIERRREALEETKKQLAEIIPQVKLLRLRGKILPKVQFFEGVEAIKQAYEDVLENNQEKLLRGITDMDVAYKNLDSKWVEYFLTKRTKLGIRCIDLVPETEGGHRSKIDDERFARTTKFLPSDTNFAGDISIYDNKVGLFTFVHDNPIGVIIEDEAIADMMKKLFDFMAAHTKE